MAKKHYFRILYLWKNSFNMVFSINPTDNIVSVGVGA